MRRARVSLTVDDPRDHPPGVRVDDRMAVAVGEHGDGAGRVVPDSGECEEILDRTGNDAAVALRDLHGGAMQPQGAARVAEIGPLPDGVGRGRSGQSSGITRFTGVCCSMNSLTSTPQAPKPGCRQGRSRALSANQAFNGVAISALRGIPPAYDPMPRTGQASRAT